MRLSSIAAVVAAGTSLGLAAKVVMERRRAPPLPRGSAADAPAVAVLLPVRDEEHDVLPCVETLLSQSLPPFVLVVDDGSSDRTRGLVEGRARGEERLAVVEAGGLPGGWGGKVHALAVGEAELVRRGVVAEWIVTTDADTRHGPELLARALAAARGYGLDAVSVAGRQEAKGVAENVSTPAVYALLDLLLGDWREAAAGGGPAVANGQLVLVRREALAAIGGFGAVRGALIDDVALAGRLREAGFSTGFFRAPQHLHIRMYRGGRETFRGWRRNLGGLLAGRPWTLAAALAGLLAPPLAVAALILRGRRAAAAWTWAAGAAASAALRATAGQQAAWALLYPADALALAATLTAGVSDRLRGAPAVWKGRRIGSGSGGCGAAGGGEARGPQPIAGATSRT